MNKNLNNNYNKLTMKIIYNLKNLKKLIHKIY